jgi:hypothetical protein
LAATRIDAGTLLRKNLTAAANKSLDVAIAIRR